MPNVEEFFYIYDSIVTVFLHAACLYISKIFPCILLLGLDAIFLNANIGAKKSN